MSPEAIAIRDTALALCAGMVGTSPASLFKYIGCVPVEQEPDEQLPSLLLIATREGMTADEDATAGTIRFINSLSLSALISVSGTDRDKADARLSRRMSAVMSTLLRDVGFIGLIEGIPSATATRVFSHDGERFFARAQIEFVFQYRTEWPPVITDDYAGADFTTRPADSGGETPAILSRFRTTS